MTEAAGERWAGMSALECRDAIVDALRAEGLVSGQEPYEHAVPYSHRSGERIEPLISLQWFMNMERLAKAAAEAVEDGRIRITPEGQRKRYLDWLANIRPWCISRQLWWGHQIPVYYRGDETFVGMEPPSGEGWERDPDVLDTWFSSALWPFATLGWPDQTPELKAFYPTNVLSTARDILFLWVARMVMMGLEFAGDVPFTDVYVHSVIQAPDGRRMSKSLGTGIDPIDLIDVHGADAVRFGLLAMSSTQDVRFNEDKIAQGAALAQKLYSASRLIQTRANDVRGDAIEDRWILSRLERVKAETARAVEAFEFHHAALGLYDFVYGELCDWYLEMVKPRLETEGGVARHVLRETLAMAHPVIPFVTEEIWAALGEDGLLAEATWPAGDEHRLDDGAESEVFAAIDVIRAVRGWRNEMAVKPGAILPAQLEGHDGVRDVIARLARLEWAEGDVALKVGPIGIIRSDQVDWEAGETRRRKRVEALQSDLKRVRGKLDNPKFRDKAPATVVAKEEAKAAEIQAELDALEQ